MSKITIERMTSLKEIGLEEIEINELLESIESIDTDYLSESIRVFSSVKDAIFYMYDEDYSDLYRLVDLMLTKGEENPKATINDFFEDYDELVRLSTGRCVFIFN